MLMLLLHGCGDNPGCTPNLTIEGVMEEAKKRTTTGTWTGSSHSYEVRLRSNTGQHYVRFGSAQLSDSDLQSSVGQQVTVQCLQDDARYQNCSGCAKLFVGGREITRTKAPQ